MWFRVHLFDLTIVDGLEIDEVVSRE